MEAHSLLALDECLLQDLRTRLTRWFDEYARTLPWRATQDAYAIWLSEIILQQTQVVQGIGYYYKFLELFPDIHKLANAQEDEVLRVWQGLGYYSRGRNLLKAARIVTQEYGGVFPDTLDEIKRLPGVGPYTQAAILSFAYNKPYATVDGNVYRVLSRLGGDPTPIDTSRGQKHFQAIATHLLDKDYPGRHNQAMIELGALVCTPRNPQCSHCPLQPYCQAYTLGEEPTRFPIKQGKIIIKHRHLNFICIKLPNNKILIERRCGQDIWQGLYQFPLVETLSHCEDISSLINTTAFTDLYAQLEDPVFKSSIPKTRKHRLTHQLLHCTLFELEAKSYRGSSYQEINSDERDNYAMPALLLKLLT